jgi:pyruvate,water dikinase
MMKTAAEYIRWLFETGTGDVALLGGKTASTGEICREPAAQGGRALNRFAITADVDDLFPGKHMP